MCMYSIHPLKSFRIVALILSFNVTVKLKITILCMSTSNLHEKRLSFSNISNYKYCKAASHPFHSASQTVAETAECCVYPTRRPAQLY